MGIRENPNENAPSVQLNWGPDRVVHVEGYNTYRVDDMTVTTEREGGMKWHIISPYLDIRGKTVLDLGCNTGLFSVMACRHGAARVTSIDLDPACIRAVSQLKHHFQLPILPVQGKVEAWKEPADTVFAFALIHWIYNCTAQFGSLPRIAQYFRELTREHLFIEWVDPADTMIQRYHHLELGGGTPEGEYTVEEFERAFEREFEMFTSIGAVRPTRIIYYGRVHE